MKNILYVITLTVFCATKSYGQQFGYFGKKNIVSVYSTVNPRVLSALNLGLPLVSYPNGYKVNSYTNNNQLMERTKVIRYDLRLSYKRQLFKGLAIGAEVGYEKFALPTQDGSELIYVYDEWGNSNGAYFENVSSPVFNLVSYMIVVDLFSKYDVSLVGLTPSFGIGPKIYYFDRNQNYRSSENFELMYPYPNYNKNMVAIDAFFDLTYRIPLNRTILFDIGMRIRSGFLLERGLDFEPQSSDETGFTEYNYTWSKSTLIQNLRTENTANFINLKLGLTFAL